MKLLRTPMCAALALFAGTSFSDAALLIYEGYDYSLSEGADMNGVATDATGFSGNYAVTGALTGSVVYNTTGLSFGGNYLPTTGGATTMSAAANSNSSRLLTATVSVGGAQTGTIWSSYLVDFTSRATFTGATAQARVTGGVNHFHAHADNAANLNTGVGYNATVSTTGGTTLALTTTYLMLSSYTNVGTALDGTTTGVASLWVFDVAAYDNWLTFGGGLEANLGDFALSAQTAPAVTTGTFTFGDSNTFQFAVSNTGGGSAGAQTAIYDELRWGSTLGDVVNVVPVPEPSTYGAIIAAGMLGLAAIRRRARSIRSAGGAATRF